MSIQNIGRNKWRVSVRTSELLKNGKPKYISQRVQGSKQDAEREEALLKTQAVSPAEMTLEHFWRLRWWPSLHVGDNTRRCYEQASQGILAALGFIKLKNLKAYDVERYIMQQPEGSLRLRAKGTLSVALRCAYRWRLTPENLMDYIKVDGPR